MMRTVAVLITAMYLMFGIYTWGTRDARYESYLVEREIAVQRQVGLQLGQEIPIPLPANIRQEAITLISDCILQHEQQEHTAHELAYNLMTFEIFASSFTTDRVIDRETLETCATNTIPQRIFDEGLRYLLPRR